MFTKKVEDFVCAHCGEHVIGNGYTNHCPACLWGKHVDIDPGDRAELCHGLMRPVSVQMHHGKYVLEHTCIRCGITRKNTTGERDDFNVLLDIARGYALGLDE